MNKKESIFFGWKKGSMTKLLAMVLAIVVVLCGSIGGTYAWMMAKTNPVVNTFVFGNINLTLTETDVDGDGNPNKNTYNLMPGKIITKDPKVTVTKESEDCWLFVKLEQSDNFGTYMEYEIAEGWTALGENEPGVYYMEWPTAESNPEEDSIYSVLKDDAVKVKDTVTEAMILELNDTKAYPQLTITAYAVQRDADVEEINEATKAWELIKAEQAETTNQ